MPITLEAARSACQQGRWHAILVVPPGASANEICRARRRLQLTEHIDKGGCAELSQLISQAADELLTRCPKPWAPTREGEGGEWWEELARQAEEEFEKRRRNMEEEVRERKEKQRREQEEYWRGFQEIHRRERARAHEDTVRRVGHRRTRCKGPAYLGELAGKAFLAIRRRIRKLQETGKHHRAQALAYAVEAEIAARRLARRPVSPRQRDCPSETLIRPRGWTSCGLSTKKLTIDFVMFAEPVSPKTSRAYASSACLPRHGAHCWTCPHHLLETKQSSWPTGRVFRCSLEFTF